jgi:hypothetical protein
MGTTLQIVRSPILGVAWYRYEHEGRWDPDRNPGAMEDTGKVRDPEARTSDVVRAAGLDPEAVSGVQRWSEGEVSEQVVSFEVPDDGIERPEPLDIYGL